MSRVGKQPIPVPSGVEISNEGQLVRVKGPKGELSYRLPEEVELRRDGDVLTVERLNDDRRSRALHGLSRSLVANMVQGVTVGFQKNLELVGTGYRASTSGNKLVLNVGYSHPVEMIPPKGVEVETPAANSIVVRGADKEQVGTFAANVRAVREPEPYLGKGIRYVGERVRRKVGKTGK